ncbi:hypothetical protein G6F66_012724 [Rhizopus arrhizus]|nr:hypothetical protein G6F66_012724 [Rhizopus arrhizus]
MSGVQEDVQMGSPTASSEWPSGGGPSIRVNKNVFESLLQAVSQNRRSRPVQKGNRSQVQCFGCQGFGHYKSECPTWKKHSPSSQKGFRRQPNRNHRSLNTIFSTLSRGATVRSAPAVGDLVDLHSDTDHENLSQDRSFLSNVNNKDSDLPLYEFVLFSEFGKRNIKALLDTGASSNYISSALVLRIHKIIVTLF